MKANAYLKLETRRAKKNGKYPLKVRVVYQSQYHDYKTKFDLTEEEYNEAVSAKPKMQFRKLSADIAELKARINGLIDKLPIFTFQKFEDGYYERIKDASNLYAIFDTYIKDLQSEGRITTALSYTNALNSFKDFKSKVSLYDVDVAFLKKYQEYRVSKGTSLTTVGIYMRSLRAVYNYASSQGIIKKDENYPFVKGKYTIPAGRNVKKALTIEEVSRIYNYETIPGTYMDRAKDFWMLSYFCNGMNFKDIALLKVNDLDGDYLRFVREKTKHTGQGNRKIISCFLTDKAKRILSKWRVSGNKKNQLLFGILDENDSPLVSINKIKQFIKSTNHYINQICNAVGIEKKVTTYFSRHSAATVLKRSGASIAQIQEALGHSTQAVTQSYLDSFDDDTKKSLANSLSNL